MRETRVISGGIEIEWRGEGESSRPGIRGRVNTYGVVTDLGPFTEEVREGFFEPFLKQDVRGLFNHDPNMLLGRARGEDSDTMALSHSREGLDYDIPELPAARADVAEAIDRGDLDGNSFSFAMPRDGSGEEWLPSDKNRSKPHRILHTPSRAYDVGPVTFPAYQNGTSVSLRDAEAILASAESRGLIPAAELPEVPAEVANAGESSENQTTSAAARSRELELAEARMRMG